VPREQGRDRDVAQLELLSVAEHPIRLDGVEVELPVCRVVEVDLAAPLEQVLLLVDHRDAGARQRLEVGVGAGMVAVGVTGEQQSS
jgi:hypothetical protein